MAMTKYSLNIHFSEEDLAVIAKAHQKVVLVKHSDGDSDSSYVWGDINSSPNMIALEHECYVNDDNNSHIDVIPAPANFFGSPELERFSLTTDSGEEFATVVIPKDVIETAKNFSVIYDEEKKEYYLQVE